MPHRHRRTWPLTAWVLRRRDRRPFALNCWACLAVGSGRFNAHRDREAPVPARSEPRAPAINDSRTLRPEIVMPAKGTRGACRDPRNSLSSQFRSKVAGIGCSRQRCRGRLVALRYRRGLQPSRSASGAPAGSVWGLSQRRARFCSHSPAAPFRYFPLDPLLPIFRYPLSTRGLRPHESHECWSDRAVLLYP